MRPSAMIALYSFLSLGFFFHVHADETYGPKPQILPPLQSPADNLCELLGNLKDYEEAKAHVLKKARDTFLASLDPKLRGIIHEPKDMTKPMYAESDKLPSKLRNDPWKPENIPEIEKINPAYNREKELYLKRLSEYEADIYHAANEGSANPAYDISPESIEKRATDLSQALLKQVQESKDLSDPVKQQISQRLSGVKVLTAHSLMLEIDPFEREIDGMVFTIACGQDYTAMNAFAMLLPRSQDVLLDEKKKPIGLKPGTKLQPKFLVCPGVATTVGHLKYKSLGLDFTIAHELSHLITIDPNVPNAEKTPPGLKNPLGLDTPLLSVQVGLFDCLQKNYDDQFRSLQTVIDQLTPIYEQQKRTDSISIFFSREGGAISQAKGLIEAFNEYLGHPPSVMDSHAAEILGDYWATEATAPDLLKIKDQPLEKSLASIMALFCTMQTSKPQVIPDGDEGVHPSNDFRIENFMRYPAFQKVLEKSDKVKPPRGPWCDI